MSAYSGNAQGTFNATSNSFKITYVPQNDFFQYSIEFTSSNQSKISRRKKIELFHHLQNTVCPSIFRPRIIYDGDQVGYCAAILDFNGSPCGSFTISQSQPQVVNKGVTIRITRTLSENINPRDACTIISKGMTAQAQVAINLIQNIVRQWPNMHHTNNGRAYFPMPKAGGGRKIGGGLELLRGIYQSVRPCSNPEYPLVLQLDTCTAAVYQSGRLQDLCMEILGARNVADLRLPSNSSDFRTLERQLKKVKVKYDPRGRFDKLAQLKTKIVHGLVEAAGNYQFMHDDRLTTVAAHIKKVHGLSIRYTDIIGVRFTNSNADLQVIVPLECCFVEPGQLYRNKIPDALVPKVVEFATLKPDVKKRAILESVKNYTASEFIAEAGIQIESRPVMTLARQLPQPQIIYGQNKNARVGHNGSWNVARSEGIKLYQPTALHYWGYINFRPDTISESDFKSRMMDLCKRSTDLGMGVRPPLFNLSGNPQHPTAALDLAKKAIVENKLSPDVKIVVIVGLPDSAAEIRHLVKHWGDVVNGYITQCMRISRIQNANEQYWSNIVLKLNARLGGCNDIVNSDALRDAMIGESGKEETVIFGADASHPGPGVCKPTIASLVFSRNAYATSYAAITTIQEPRTEVINDLETMVHTALRCVAYERGPDRIVTRLIFFRDGVSEGEYDEIRRTELTAIERAIDKVWNEFKISKPKPKITFVVVGKRHHSVFFQGEANCPVGTVVDRDVTLPTERDFYLQSHSAIKGTARSAHYIVLRDDIFGSMQPIQEVAYALCYVYAKATRSVSIPAPVYYADLACGRGDFHFDPRSPLLTDNGSMSSGSSNAFDLDAWKRAFGDTHDNMKRRMYFL